ncbi:hypothetical protein [Amycolatopsis suaedae]|uniref:Uncharacterized protein n=1 Tax=Amycolatopsis suaedae TaxID=2510978 RepID=A0A4Q7J616_9PSEU|nr:hypothetical protein [Amycolatopsis suaedae]RZQ62577.1 hypothetical protein EWH70_16505 [Amycolatopsis suaedae]
MGPVGLVGQRTRDRSPAGSATVATGEHGGRERRMWIGDRVGMRLVHVTGIEARANQTITRYTVQIVWADRPAEGVRTGRVRCAECGTWVKFEIRDAASTRARRRWLIAAGVVSAVVLAGLVLLVTRIDDLDLGGLEAYLGPLLGIALAAPVIGLVLVGTFAPAMDGVRRPDVKRQYQVHHGFRPSSPRLLWRNPPAVDVPAGPRIEYDDAQRR